MQVNDLMTTKGTLLRFVLLFAVLASSSALAQQYARPDSTGATGTFTNVGGAPTFHDAVNEATGDASADATYVDSGVGNSSSITFASNDSPT